jgi:hypothetical protein
MTVGTYNAIYDFELMPYALGDVLTWNVQTAILCELGKHERVDVHICLDERSPASIYQKEMITPENCGIYFNELFSAFGTHPYLGSLFVYRRREDMIERLEPEAARDPLNAEAFGDYRAALGKLTDLDALVAYFTKYIYYHERINDFARSEGRIPLLHASLGCGPDVEGLLTRRLAGRKVVVVHPRLRRLDAGYAGSHTHFRDSDFLEWYEFLKGAEAKHPEVQFVMVGRLQEKPIEFLRLPNVISLRSYGLGLGHELTLMLRANLFIGTSSGFAAMANFSEIPYFITKMNKESCNAYRIPEGAERLPFANERQVLVYEPESRELLDQLLMRGLHGAAPPAPGPGPSLDPRIDVDSWEAERARWLQPGSTTARFLIDDDYVDKETAFLLAPRLDEARAAWRNGRDDRAWGLLQRIEAGFPRMVRKHAEVARLRQRLEANRSRWGFLWRTKLALARMIDQMRDDVRRMKEFAAHLRRLWRSAKHPRYVWNNRHKIPRKMRELLRRFAALARGS